jgi:hypothetical protein
VRAVTWMQPATPLVNPKATLPPTTPSPASRSGQTTRRCSSSPHSQPGSDDRVEPMGRQLSGVGRWSAAEMLTGSLAGFVDSSALYMPTAAPRLHGSATTLARAGTATMVGGRQLISDGKCGSRT